MTKEGIILPPPAMACPPVKWLLHLNCEPPSPWMAQCLVGVRLAPSPDLVLVVSESVLGIVELDPAVVEQRVHCDLSDDPV